MIKNKIKRTRRTWGALLHAALSEEGRRARQVALGPLQPPGARALTSELVARVLRPRALALQGTVRAVVTVGAARLATHTYSHLTLLTLLFGPALRPKVFYANLFVQKLFHPEKFYY